MEVSAGKTPERKPGGTLPYAQKGTVPFASRGGMTFNELADSLPPPEPLADEVALAPVSSNRVEALLPPASKKPDLEADFSGSWTASSQTNIARILHLKDKIDIPPGLNCFRW